MKRYTAVDMVRLPRFTAAGAMALGERLVTAAKPHSDALAPPVAQALGDLGAQHRQLKVVLRDQAGAPEDPALSIVPYDRTLDGCWGGLDAFLGGYEKLPSHYSQAGEASMLRATIFPDGLVFLTLASELEWTESELRLERIRKNGLDARIEALGGRVFLDALTEAHAAYGQVLGMTAPVAEPAPAPPRVRDALDGFTGALRDYVVKVMGTVDARDPATQALADRLLAPLASWSVGTGGRANAKDAPAPAEEPPSEPAVSPV